MLDFLRKGLHSFICIAFVLTVIACAFVGGFSFGFFGIIIGASTGIILSIGVYGTIATLVDIADNTEMIKKHLSDIYKPSVTKTENTASTSNPSDSKDCWGCKKCGETNYGNSVLCSNCHR